MKLGPCDSTVSNQFLLKKLQLINLFSKKGNYTSASIDEPF